MLKVISVDLCGAVVGSPDFKTLLARFVETKMMLNSKTDIHFVTFSDFLNKPVGFL